MPGTVRARRTQESKTDRQTLPALVEVTVEQERHIVNALTHVKHQEIQVVVGLVISF